MKLPKRNLEVQELINKTDEESHTILGPIDKSADSDAVIDETVEISEAQSERNRNIAEFYHEAERKKAEAEATATSSSSEQPANEEPTPETSIPTEENPQTNPEEDIDENDKVFAACLKAAGDMGYTGESQKLRAKELYHTHVNEKEKEKAAQAAEQMAQEMGGGGGGAPGITGLISRMFSKSGNSGKLSREGLSERVLNHRVQQFNNNFHSMAENIKELDYEVGVLNETFTKSLGGGALAEIAAENNISVPELVSDIESGKNKSAQARLALDYAMSDPEYNAQWKKVTETRLKMTEAAERTSASLAKLDKSHGDRFDSETVSKKMLEQLDTANKGKKPIAGTTEDKNLAKDFQKQLDDMMDRMRKAIARVLDKVVQIFAK